ncbi:hypothetical protein ACS5NO_32065 [Larkinella sp. GY13]|uniref:hypothetical protein n=1 Tax=Larkinella sp. GY13 TaxID=3453720 RepID=UPI003EEA89C1
MEKRQRKVYDRQEYAEKTNQLRQLLAQITPPELDQATLQVFGNPGPLVQVQLVGADEMALFHALSDFDCRLIKLINFARPAIRIHYYEKHKYFLDKKPALDEIKGYLFTEIDTLEEKLRENPDSINAHQKLSQLKGWIKQIHHKSFAISNYYKFYRYDYIAYNYLSFQGVETASTHLIKHTTNRKNEVTIERTNVVFVDPEGLSTPTSHDNKQITKYLAEFPEQFEFPRFTLYVK